MRRRYVQGKDGKLREIRREGSRTHFVQGDIEPFVSPVDGSVIASNRDLREHNRRHGVIQSLEWGNETELIQKRQHEEQHGPAARRERAEAIAHAVDQHRNNTFKTYQQFVDSLRGD